MKYIVDLEEDDPLVFHIKTKGAVKYADFCKDDAEDSAQAEDSTGDDDDGAPSKGGTGHGG